MIKILFLAANPLGTDPLALDEEIREIDARIRGAKYRKRLKLVPHFAVRLEDLSNFLERHKPQIVHFSGHGDQKGAIILAGSDRKPKRVVPAALAGFFGVLKDNVQVVILNACYAEPQAKAIVKEIDCAIGMRDAIGDSDAIAFSAEFYQALANGRSVEEGFQLGLSRLLGEGVPDAKRLVKLHMRKGMKAAEISFDRKDREDPVTALEKALRSMSRTELAKLVLTQLRQQPDNIAAWAGERTLTASVLVRWAKAKQRIPQLHNALNAYTSK